MGLDIVIHFKDKTRKVLEISEKLHKSIFNSKIDLSDLSQIHHLHDYYKTNIFFNFEDKKLLVYDLTLIKNRLPLVFNLELQCLILELSNDKIKKVHISGD